jgi:hypothetical protein
LKKKKKKPHVGPEFKLQYQKKKKIQAPKKGVGPCFPTWPSARELKE